MANGSHPCPCCGYLEHGWQLSESDICTICHWQNDAQDLAAVFAPRGPNHVSLLEAQRNFAAFGAKESRLIDHVRKPGPGDRRDPGWRAFDPTKDITAWPVTDAEWADWKEGPYYWRPTYWLLKHGPNAGKRLE